MLWYSEGKQAIKLKYEIFLVLTLTSIHPGSNNGFLFVLGINLLCDLGYMTSPLWVCLSFLIRKTQEWGYTISKPPLSRKMSQGLN